MTREEAIKVFENPDVSVGVAARIGQDPEYWRKLKPALDMAISALRQQDQSPGSGKMMQREPMTNADRIRAMSDGELVNWIADINPFYCQTCVYAKPCRLEYDEETVNYAEKYDCKDGILKWLQQPAEEEEHDRRTEIKH